MGWHAVKINPKKFFCLFFYVISLDFFKLTFPPPFSVLPLKTFSLYFLFFYQDFFPSIFCSFTQDFFPLHFRFLPKSFFPPFSVFLPKTFSPPFSVLLLKTFPPPFSVFLPKTTTDQYGSNYHKPCRYWSRPYIYQYHVSTPLTLAPPKIVLKKKQKKNTFTSIYLIHLVKYFLKTIRLQITCINSIWH